MLTEPDGRQASGGAGRSQGPSLGAKVIRHSKAVIFQMAEVAVPRELFAAILDRIGRLRASPQGV